MSHPCPETLLVLSSYLRRRSPSASALRELVQHAAARLQTHTAGPDSLHLARQLELATGRTVSDLAREADSWTEAKPSASQPK